jgi:two-component system, LuxR family, sensor kinase FixL
MSGSSSNGGRERGYEALRESEELHRATLSSISDAVFLVDDAGAFTYICPNVDVIFGYVPDEVQAMSRLGRLLGENLFDPAELVARGELRNIEREVTAKSGERRTVLVQLKRVSIRGGTVLCTCRDVTELKHAERELAATRLDLAHAGRLALVGQLMASIVHEIQQPLTSIHANASAGLRVLRGREKSAADAELQEILSDIHGQSGTAATIVDRLRNLVRKRSLDRRALDLNTIANDVLRLVHADALRRGVTLRVEMAPSLPAVDADRVSLQQVILNLIVNAMDATAEADGEERLVVMRTHAGFGTVEVEVSDTGRGIPADHRAKLFDAFFTTKADGVGLGLAIARSIAEAHGGRIWAEEHGGPGATFRLSLPSRASAGDG